MRSLLPIMAGAAAFACAGTPAVPVSMPTAGEAGGEVMFLPLGTVGTGATFDVQRVVGPTVNMALTPEGVWGGDLRGRNLVLEVSEGRLRGAGFDVAVQREGEALRLAGLVGNRRVNVHISPKRFQGAFDISGCSFDLPRETPGSYQGFLSCPAPRSPSVSTVLSSGERLPTVTSTSLRLTGDAARLDSPVMPQLALALLAVLPL
ncbi:MAG TPA: hypothetical protein VFR85_17370 [Anaeromyxobacteraceae bacterium]|nr:hypothetical protein [Anaeromyxobacteraceae bacterium]